MGRICPRGRRLELHVRVNLGLVRYHVGTESASHDYYMRGIGVLERCHYLGFSEDPKEAFLGLAHDLAFADDFLTGTGALLRQAAMRESSDNAARHADLMAANVGDKRKAENLRRCFRQGKYGSAQESVKTMIFGRFLHFVIYDSAAAVAVGMWEAAFCAAFQAWRAGRKMPSQNSLPRPLSVISTANSRISGIFGGFSPFRPAFRAKCVIPKTRQI